MNLLTQNNKWKETIIGPENNQSFFDSNIVQLYNQRIRDFAKGTSFRFLGEWIPDKHYFNDEFVKDFVTFEGVVVACKKSHFSNSTNVPIIIFDESEDIIGIEPSDYWEFVISKGKKGSKGEKGERGYKGDAATIQVGEVETIDPSESAEIKNTGTQFDAIFNFKIPKGEKGDIGSVRNFVVLTESQYESLTSIDPNIFYYIYEDEDFYAVVLNNILYTVGLIDRRSITFQQGIVENNTLIFTTV